LGSSLPTKPKVEILDFIRQFQQEILSKCDGT